MVDREGVQRQNRTRIFAVAEQMIRRILLDHPRTHIAEKHGGVPCALELDQAIRIPRRRDLYLVSLDAAKNTLAEMHPTHGRTGELRSFRGLSIEEMAGQSRGAGQGLLEDGIHRRQKGQRAERLAGGVSLKQKSLSLNAQTKGRITGGIAS